MPDTVLGPSCELSSLILMASPGCPVPKARARRLWDVCSRKKVQMTVPARRDSTCEGGRYGWRTEKGLAHSWCLVCVTLVRIASLLRAPSVSNSACFSPVWLPPHPCLCVPHYGKVLQTLTTGVAQCPGLQGDRLGRAMPTFWGTVYLQVLYCHPRVIFTVTSGDSLVLAFIKGN